MNKYILNRVAEFLLQFLAYVLSGAIGIVGIIGWIGYFLLWISNWFLVPAILSTIILLAVVGKEITKSV